MKTRSISFLANGIFMVSLASLSSCGNNNSSQLETINEVSVPLLTEVTKVKVDAIISKELKAELKRNGVQLCAGFKSSASDKYYAEGLFLWLDRAGWFSSCSSRVDLSKAYQLHIKNWHYKYPFDLFVFNGASEVTVGRMKYTEFTLEGGLLLDDVGHKPMVASLCTEEFDNVCNFTINANKIGLQLR